MTMVSLKPKLALTYKGKRVGYFTKITAQENSYGSVAEIIIIDKEVAHLISDNISESIVGDTEGVNIDIKI